MCAISIKYLQKEEIFWIDKYILSLIKPDDHKNKIFLNEKAKISNMRSRKMDNVKQTKKNKN